MAEYYHVDRNLQKKLFDIRFSDHYFSSEQLVHHDNASVLVIQAHNTNGDYVVVPGIVRSFQSKFSGDFKNVPVSEVQPLQKEECEKELEDKIRALGFKGHINYWPPHIN